MTGDAQALATSLAPALREQCGGRLGPIEWFRCVWQAGGAATGFSTYTLPSGKVVPALVKIPVGPVELRWTATLGAVEPEAWTADQAGRRVTPRVLASGMTLSGYDLGWLVTERLHGQPLSQHLDQAAVRGLVEACADFHEACARLRAVDERPQAQDWEKAVGRARESVRTHALAEGQRWNEALKRVQRVLEKVVGLWESRRINCWCHGDLHPGNALARADEDGCAGRGCVLIDLALVHAGHWVEDAVYLERQYWGHEDRLHGVKPVSTLGQIRRQRGLPMDDNYAEIATARRVLMAAAVPLFIDREHNARYTHGALEVLEKYLPQIH